MANAPTLIDGLPAAALRLAVRRRLPQHSYLEGVRLTPYIPRTPHAQQALFLARPETERLFGGAGGGGKSEALLMSALQYVDQPEYACLILRKTYADLALPGALMSRAAGWLRRTNARWLEREKTWRFPSGATITFGYLEHAGDELRYDSAEFTRIIFDELTQFPLHQYRFMFARLRRPSWSEIPLHLDSATNPGGEGHGWVRQRFGLEGRPRQPITVSETGEMGAETRVFVPARLEDNPSIDQEAYIRSLGELDEASRLRRREGDWDVANAGGKFKREWFGIIPEAPADLVELRYWDTAASEPTPEYPDPDWTVGLRGGWWEAARKWVISDIVRARLSPHGVDRLMLQTAQVDGRRVPIYIEREPGASGKKAIDEYEAMLRGFEVYGNPATRQKELRIRPVRSAAEAGNVLLVEGPWIRAFLDEAEAYDESGKVHDDQLDTAAGMIEVLAGTAREEVSDVDDILETLEDMRPNRW